MTSVDQQDTLNSIEACSTSAVSRARDDVPSRAFSKQRKKLLMLQKYEGRLIEIGNLIHIGIIYIGIRSVSLCISTTAEEPLEFEMHLD